MRDTLQPMVSNYVYLIANRDIANRYKIGVSNNPTSRLNKLQSDTGCYLELIATQLCHYAYEVENYLHKEYKSNHYKGEWFSFSAEELLAIKQRYLTESFDYYIDDSYKVKINPKAADSSPYLTTSPYESFNLFLMMYYGKRYGFIRGYSKMFDPRLCLELEHSLNELNDSKIAIMKRKIALRKKLNLLLAISADFPTPLPLVFNRINYVTCIDEEQWDIVFDNFLLPEVKHLKLGDTYLFDINTMLSRLPDCILDSKGKVSAHYLE